MVISLNPEDWSRRRLRDGSRLPALASSLVAAESEIAAGRIALFTPRLPAASSLLLSHGCPYANLDCRSAEADLPGFHQAPLLYAARTFLWWFVPPATIPLLPKHVNILRCASLIG